MMSLSRGLLQRRVNLREMSMYSVYITPYTTRFPALDKPKESRHGTPDLRVRGRERNLYVRDAEIKKNRITRNCPTTEDDYCYYYIRRAYVCSGTSLRYVC